MTPRQKKEYYTFVIPSILAFALGDVYSIVDGFFIGHCLGDPGLASVTIGYPLAVLIQAVGTGLGLAITRRIIQAHHGTITLRSARYAGTVFILTLPIEKNS